MSCSGFFETLHKKATRQRLQLLAKIRKQIRNNRVAAHHFPEKREECCRRTSELVKLAVEVLEA